MDRTENSLTAVSEFAEEANEVLCRLAVQTGGRLIEEEE